MKDKARHNWSRKVDNGAGYSETRYTWGNMGKTGESKKEWKYDAVRVSEAMNEGVESGLVQMKELGGNKRGEKGKARKMNEGNKRSRLRWQDKMWGIRGQEENGKWEKGADMRWE